MYVTKVSLKKADSKTVEDLLGWCHFCEGRDISFRWQRVDDKILIQSDGSNQAYKRGSAIYKRFHLHYNVEYSSKKLLS